MVLSISPDDGETWEPLASGEGNYGSFFWHTIEHQDGTYLLKVTADSKASKGEQTLEVTIDNPDYGSLYISSTPGGASIIIDGDDLGETNMEVKIPAGYHTVELQKEGYSPWTQWIEVKKGKNPDMEVRLIPSTFGLSPVHILAVILGLVLFAIILLLFYVKGRKE